MKNVILNILPTGSYTPFVSTIYCSNHPEFQTTVTIATTSEGNRTITVDKVCCNEFKDKLITTLQHSKF